TTTIPQLLTPTIVPYTTLFRSARRDRAALRPALRDGAPPRVRGRRDPDRPRQLRQPRREARRPPRRDDRPARRRHGAGGRVRARSEEHTSELQSRRDLVCRLLL